MQDCGELLAEIIAHGDERAASIVARLKAGKKLVPGFGHHLHKPDDPRSIALLALAKEKDVARNNVKVLYVLAEAVRKSAGKHVTINATGAIAAILADLEVPREAMRGLSIVARAAGLVAHIVEESKRPSARYIWDLVDKSIPFKSEGEST
jgi:citrate synthase